MSYTSKKDEEFFGAIGRLVVSWSSLEMALDAMIDLIHRGLGGNKLEPERPRALQRKLNYLRRYFKSLPGMEPSGLAGFLLLFKQIEDLSESRHDIIHGAVLENAEGSGEAKMLRFLHKGGLLEHKNISTDTASILRSANEAMQLSNKTFGALNAMYEFLSEQMKSDDAENP